MSNRYVSMLMFNRTYTRVALLIKNRPAFLAGKVTPVGGRPNQDESDEDAVVREFEEETLVKTSTVDWTKFATLIRGDARMECYFARSEDVELCRTNYEEENYEQVYVVDVKDVLMAAVTPAEPGREATKLLQDELSVSDDLAALIGLALRARSEPGITTLIGRAK